MAGKKTSVYLTPEDSARLDAVHEAMRRDPRLRRLDLKWSDSFRLLLRRALAEAELEYLHKIPDDADAGEWLGFLRDEYEKQAAILRDIDEQQWREQPGFAAQFRPDALTDEDWDELIKAKPSFAKYRNAYLAKKKTEGE